jgi:RNA polymerase sigma-70 factor (ECF subfamily)
MYDRDALNRLYRYCRVLCEQESDACDLLQGAMERCIKAPPRRDGAAISYALRVIRNLFIDQRRSDARVRLEPFDEDGVALDFDLASLERTVLEQDELEAVWSEMTVVEREILYLWAVEGHSTDEVAAHLDKPRNSVLSIIHRMRKRLKARFGDARSAG